MSWKKKNVTLHSDRNVVIRHRIHMVSVSPTVCSTIFILRPPKAGADIDIHASSLSLGGNSASSSTQHLIDDGAPVRLFLPPLSLNIEPRLPVGGVGQLLGVPATFTCGRSHFPANPPAPYLLLLSQSGQSVCCKQNERGIHHSGNLFTFRVTLLQSRICNSSPVFFEYSRSTDFVIPFSYVHPALTVIVSRWPEEPWDKPVAWL